MTNGTCMYALRVYCNCNRFSHQTFIVARYFCIQIFLQCTCYCNNAIRYAVAVWHIKVKVPYKIAPLGPYTVWGTT